MSSELDREALDRQISAALLKLQVRSPFFAALCRFARFLPDETLPTAATDGRDVRYNPTWLSALEPAVRRGALLHEVLHAALLHPSRRGTRDPERWNIAADVVVNGIVVSEQLPLAPGAVREPDLEHLRAEEIYALLSERPRIDLPCGCFVPGPAGDPADGPDALGRLAQIEADWKRALRHAEAMARTQGRLPAGAARLIAEAAAPQLDWRTRLWRFLVRTPNDFSGFDRRHLWRGLYLEELVGERLAVHVAVDTSGSIRGRELEQFMGEVRGIVAAYPHLEGRLYYADAALYGPHPLDREIPPPKGGGGTSFVPFFQAIAGAHEGVCVYLTDGHGTFPPDPPQIPTLWVVVPGGLADERFPFGEVVRLV